MTTKQKLSKKEANLIKKIRSCNKKEYGKYRGRYNPTTFGEAINKVYLIKPVSNCYGDYSSGKIIVPKCLNGYYVKLSVQLSKN